MRVPVEPPRLPAILALPRVSGIMLRRLPSEPRLLLLVAVVCATAFILSATPRYLVQVSDDGIRQAVGGVPARQSSISVIVEDRIGLSGTDNSFTDLHERGATYHAELPDVVREVTRYQNYLAETPDFQVIDGSGSPLYASQLLYNYLSVRYQGDVWDHLTLTSGRLPAPREPMLPSMALGMEVQFDSLTPFVEIALSEATAQVMHATLGDRLLVKANFGSTFVPGIGSDTFTARQRLIVEIVGIIAVNDPDDAYWLGDTRLRQPDRSQAGEQIFTFGTVLAAEDEQLYGDLYRASSSSTTAPLAWRYTWNFPALPDEFNSDATSSLAAELRRLESTRGPSDRLLRGADAQIRSGLPAIIDTYAAQQRAFTTILALAAAGLLALSLVLIALLATLIVERRRGGFALMRGRGASTTQLVVSQAVESALVIIPATAFGLLLAVIVVQAGTVAAPRSIAVVVAVAASALLVSIAYARLIRPPLRTVDRPLPDHGRRSQQRLVIEIAVIIMALLGALLLRRRGLDGGVSAERGGLLAVDPYLALTPVLLGLAIGLLSARALPIVAGLLARWLSRRRGLVGFVALRRIGRASGESTLPLIALLLAVAVSGFCLIVADSINHGQSEAALLTTGADFRIESASGFDLLPEQLALDAFPGIESAARLSLTLGITARTSARVPDRIALVAIEPEAYRRVIDGTPLAPVYAGSLAALEGGLRDGAVPALVSPGWANRRSLKVGDTFQTAIGSQDTTMVVQGYAMPFPGVAASDSHIIVTYADLQQTATAFAEFRPTHVYLRAQPAVQPALEAALASLDVAPLLISRVDTYERSRSSPLTGGVATGFRLTVGASAIFATLASIAALIISARQRSRDLGFLRTMGLTQRQALRLVIVENVPMVLAAAVIGAGLGIAIAWVIEPGFDLSPFAGAPPGQTTLHINPFGILAISAVITAIVLFCTTLFVVFTRRAHLGQLLRVGDE